MEGGAINSLTMVDGTPSMVEVMGHASPEIQAKGLYKDEVCVLHAASERKGETGSGGKTKGLVRVAAVSPIPTPFESLSTHLQTASTPDPSSILGPLCCWKYIWRGSDFERAS